MRCSCFTVCCEGCAEYINYLVVLTNYSRVIVLATEHGMNESVVLLMLPLVSLLLHPSHKYLEGQFSGVWTQIKYV